jgi:hypothetical protein
MSYHKSTITTNSSWAAVVRGCEPTPTPTADAGEPKPMPASSTPTPTAGAGMPAPPCPRLPGETTVVPPTKICGDYIYLMPWDTRWEDCSFGPSVTFTKAGYADLVLRQHPKCMSIFQSLLDMHGGCILNFEIIRHSKVFQLTLHFGCSGGHCDALGDYIPCNKCIGRPVKKTSKTVSFTFGDVVSTGCLALALSDFFKVNDIALKPSKVKVVLNLMNILFEDGLFADTCGL